MAEREHAEYVRRSDYDRDQDATAARLARIEERQEKLRQAMEERYRWTWTQILSAAGAAVLLLGVLVSVLTRK